VYHILASTAFFAVAAPGVAPYTALELEQLGLLPPARAVQAGAEAGGVAFNGDLRALYRANLHLRTANRVLVRLGEFRAVGFGELRKLAARLPWERYLTPSQPLALRVTCHKSRLYHSDAVAERVAAAAGDRLGKLPSLQKFDEENDDPAQSGEPPQLVIVRLLHDRCTISIDSSGDLLHRRGYRLATAKAPLRETLAAAMLLASGWRAGRESGQSSPPLLDPFCGSGTIAIEAALLALGIAPGLAAGQARRYAFMNWPDYDAGLWQEMLAAAEAHRQRQLAASAASLSIGAADRDAGAVATAQANAARAGVAEYIQFACRPVSALEPPAGAMEPGWVVANPPYGVRVSAGQDVRNLYAQFGKALRAACPGWHVAILCNDRGLLGQLGLRLDTSLALVNGGIAVTLGYGIVGP
jgi:putative N6-adenine-specific DNA methylase